MALPSSLYEPQGRKTLAGSPWNGSWPVGFDKNNRLTRPGTWATEAARMMTDPKLLDLAHQTRTAMLQGTWLVKLPKDSQGNPEAERNAEFIRQAFGFEGRACHAQRPWEAMLGQMSRWAEVGFRVMETNYQFDESDGQVWLKDIFDIEPASIVGWLRDANSEIIAVEQDGSRTGTHRYRNIIPVERTLLILTNGLAGDQVTGQGMLRACWFWWKLKESLAKQMGVAAEKWAIPTLAASVDTSAMQAAGMAEADITAAVNGVNQTCNNYAANEQAWVKEMPGVVYRILAQGAFTPAAFREAIGVCDEQMAAAWSASFKAIGMSGEGSRAIGEVHYDAWKVAVANRMDYIAGAMQKVVNDLLEINFYENGVPASVRPHLAHTGLEVDGLADALGALPGLISAGVVTPTAELERRVLKLLNVEPGPGSERSSQERMGGTSAIITTDNTGGAGRPVGS